MAAYTAAYVAGAYSVTYSSQAMGFTESGFEWIMRPAMNPIRADVTGRVPLDGILTGVEDCIVRCEFIEYSVAAWDLATAWVKGTVAGRVNNVGALMSTKGASLVLAPIGGGNSAKTYTFAKAYPMEPVRTIFSAQRLRTITAGFYCFASSIDSTTYETTLFAVTP